MITAFLSPFILLGFCTAYWGFSPRFDNERKRAYILSVISSFFMTCVSISFVWHYLRYGIQGVFEKGQEGWMRGLTEVSVVFFGTYLFADLFVGYFNYRSQVGLLTGWIHHTVYIGLMIYLYNTRLSPIFLTAAIMEFPTFDLAISNLFPRVRNDLRFLSSFFLIRILFHFILLLDCTRPVSRNITDGSYVPSAMLGLAFVLHVSWFHGGVIGYIKRSKKQSNMTLTDDVPEEVHGILPELEVGTPEDSPLVTPHTPKTYAVLSNLPNLPSMPQIPNINLGSMPTVSIPSFADLSAAIHSRDQLNFGFKEAVKNRWEEQKDKFAGMRRGGGMGLQLNRFGMRRRSSLEEVGSDDDL